MKKFFVILSFFFLLNSMALAQEFIENPEKPSSENAGRALQLEEVFRITDESGDFYFSAPVNLKVNSEGCFFIIDDNQILKFSADGKFLKNLFKKGQGPGELSTRYHSGLSYFLFKDEIFLHDFNGNKIIRMDDEGNLIEEIKLKTTRLQRMYGPTDEGFIFIYESPFFIGKGPTGFKDVDISIILVSKDGSTSQTIMVFPKKVYRGRDFGMDLASFFVLFDIKAQQIFVSHTGEYKIVSADLNTGQVIRSFNRKYSRAKYVIPEGLKGFYERHNPPERKYENDILGLFFYKFHLLVKTSTKDEKKGVLFDVFSREGKYIDSFYLDLKGKLMAVQGDCIFVSEKDEDENIQIVKYIIIA